MIKVSFIKNCVVFVQHALSISYGFSVCKCPGLSLVLYDRVHCRENPVLQPTVQEVGQRIIFVSNDAFAVDNRNYFFNCIWTIASVMRRI